MFATHRRQLCSRGHGRPASIRLAVAALLAATSLPLIGGVASAAVPGLLFDMVVDEARGKIYGSDRSAGVVHVIDTGTLEAVGSVDLGEGSAPTGLDLSPDGSELAVALFGSGQVAFIDLETLLVSATPTPEVTVGPNRPFDVLYGREGRLYSVGNPGSSGLDYVHVFDTATHTEIGKSTEIMRAAPRLAMTADMNTVYVSQVIFSPQKIYRFDISTDTPTQTAAAPHGPVQVNTIAVNDAGTEVYSSRGQVWSGDLTTQLGSFVPAGEEIEYSAAHDRFYVTSGASITEYHAASHQPTVTRMLLSPGGVARVSGETLYVSTEFGVEAHALDISNKCGGRSPTIIGTSGPDVIQGTDNTDVVLGLGGNDTISGLRGKDFLCGGSGKDVLIGGSGADRLYGNGGSDLLKGGNGNDRMYGGSGNDVLIPASGADTVVGNTGRDRAVFSGAAGPVAVDLAAGTATGQGTDVLRSVEDVLGSPFDDILRGDGKVNRLDGGDGSDEIFGAGGADTLLGGSGADFIDGGTGSDVIRGQSGADMMLGGRGNDDLDGGSGGDFVSYESASLPVMVDLATGTATGAGTDKIARVVNIVGSRYADTLRGNGKANAIFGLKGADEILGFSGNDVLDGGSGADQLGGGGGDDLLIGGTGNDSMEGGGGLDILAGEAGSDRYDGGAGNDWADFEFAAGPVVASLVTNTATGEGTDSLSSIEFLFGSDYGDTLTGNSFFNVLVGWEGDDVLRGGGAGDNLWGEAGSDSLYGDSGNDYLNGGPGNDSLNGGTGTDYCEEGENNTSCENPALDVALSGFGIADVSKYSAFKSWRQWLEDRYGIRG